MNRLIFLVAASACAAQPHKSPLAARAEFDLNCADGQLRYRNLDEPAGKVYGVSGCNRRATYTWTEHCDPTAPKVFAECSGQWVLNSPIQESSSEPKQEGPKQ